MCNIKIEKTETQISVESHYHPDFPAAARKLGGRWNKSAWVFDSRDETRVRDLCIDIYGTDGTTGAGEMVTLRVSFFTRFTTTEKTMFVAGRQIARVFSRDGGALLGDGVVVTEGGFYSTGSRNHPALGVKSGTIAEIRDVPRAAAEKAAESDTEWGDVTIVDERVERAVLEEERAVLVARIAEIDKLLG